MARTPQQQKNYDAEIAREKQGWITAAKALPQPVTPTPVYAPPPNAAYDSTVGNANLTYDNTNSDLNYQNAQGAQTFGFNDQGQFDPSNPFNRATLLQQSYQQAQARTTNSYAAQGQLYSGAIENARGANTNSYNQGYDSLRRQADSYYHEILNRRQDARTTRDATIAGAETARIPSDLTALRADPVTPASKPAATPFYQTPAYARMSLAKRQEYWATRRKQRGK